MKPFQDIYMFINSHLVEHQESLGKVTFPSPFQYLNGSLSKFLSSVKVYINFAQCNS